MVSRAPSFEDLATWDDLVTHVIVVDALGEEEESTEPTHIDPRDPIPEVVQIDHSMADLEAQLSSLRLRKTHLLAMHALIARMPPEILSRIFELGVHESNHLLSTISLVSRYWRQVALATPSLWSYIRLDHDWGYARHAAFLRKLRTCVERSQACKLLIDIDCRFVEGGNELEQIVTELEPHLVRCFSFRISAPDWEWMDLVRNHSSKLGPSLENLYIRLDPSESEEQTPFVFLSQPCPRLSTVTLEHTPLICIRTSLPALRSLHLIRDQRYHSSSRIGISFKELLTLLVSTPTLTELRVQSAVFLLDGTEAIFQSSPSYTLLPRLQSLTFNFLDCNNVALFLESSTLPSLKRLSVQMESNNEENMQWLVQMSLDSQTRFPTLRHLDLRACSVDGAALVPFIRALHQLPHLSALGLSSPPSGHIGSRFFDILASLPFNPSETWLLPELEALCLQNCRDVSGHELLAIVRARNLSPGVRSIRFLKISQCYGLDHDVLDQLQLLVDTVRVVA
ncbi:hypothetical protein DENSPDRAFT_821172 [Dentipellis sp. KUC8613]|nr:hypothetical protein DENSPDRAFT_821172 [Dentipellis sp. KUC8613]